MEKMKLILLFLLVCGVGHLTAQMLEVSKATPKAREMIEMIPGVLLKKSELFKIRFRGDNSDVNWMSYPIICPKGLVIDTLAVLRELLALEGDSRICVLPTILWNPLVSRAYSGAGTQYSIQVEALYIINQFFFEQPFAYSPIPALRFRDGEIESIAGPVVEEAFKSYKKWFSQLELIGVSEAKRRKLEPLSGSKARWL
jgi:hypothetical protein